MLHLFNLFNTITSDVATRVQTRRGPKNRNGGRAYIAGMNLLMYCFYFCSEKLLKSYESFASLSLFGNIGFITGRLSVIL